VAVQAAAVGQDTPARKLPVTPAGLAVGREPFQAEPFQSSANVA
jgi:hypothetical protein